MKKLYIAMAAALMLSATPSYAGAMKDMASDLQFGAGAGFIDLGLNSSGILFYGIAEKEVDVDLGDTNNTVQVRLGTSTKASSTFFGITSESSLKYLLSGLFKSTLELEDGISAYGLLGFSYASVETTITYPTTLGTITGTGTNSSLSYGIGADYEIDNDLKVAVEYASYLSNATAFAANVYFNF